MAEIKLNYTQEQLHTLLDGMNHSILALQDIYSAARIGCQIPQKFAKKFDTMPYDEIDNYTNKRLNILLDLYYYLLSFEE